MADAHKKKKRPWFRSNKGQYKKMVLAVYPAQQEEGIVQTNLSKLAFYATTTPSELEPIGAFIEKRLREDLVKRRLGWVEVGARALNELTKSCHTDLHLFGSHVMVVMRLLFEDERVELNVLAVDIFRRFAEYQDEVSQFDLDKFVPYFERMAAPGKAGTDGARLRTAGLEALDSYVQRVADPDAFVLKRIDAPPGPPTSLVSAMLSALTHAQKEKGDDKAAEAAAACLRDLGARANHLTTRILVSAVLAYIDTQKLWGTPQASDTLKILCLSIPLGSDHLTSTALLQHLDASPLSTRASIVNCITTVMRGNISSMVELVHSLLRHLQHAEVAAADLPAEMALHEAIVTCISTASKRVADPTQRLDAIAYVLDKFSLCPTALSRRSLAAVLSTLCDSLERERPRAVSQAVMSSCVSLLAHKDEEVRRAALALVLQLLSLVLQGPANNPASPAPVVRPTANFAPDMLLGTAGDLLRSGLYHHAQMAGNTLRSYVLISRVFALLLKSLGSQELVLSFPLVFRLQSRLSKSVKKDSDKTTLTNALCGHALVAAYLLCAAKLFASRELEDHVKSIIKKRKGQAGKLKVEDEGVLSAPEGASESSSLSVLDANALFNRDTCIDALGRTSALQAHAEQRAALAGKYRSKSVKYRAQPSDRKVARDLLAPLMREGTVTNPLQLSRRTSMRPNTASLRGVPHERRTEGGAVTVAHLRRAGGAQADGGDDFTALSPRSPGRSLSGSTSSPTVGAGINAATPSFAESLRSAQATQDSISVAARLISGAMDVAPQPSRYSVLAEGVSLPTLQLAY